MIDVRVHTPEGAQQFLSWLQNPKGALPGELLDGSSATEPFGDCVVDETRQFQSRYDLGCYLCEVFSGTRAGELLSEQCDGVWSWLAARWFGQLAEKKIRRSEHYVVMRKGPTGSLAYRHAVRTSYELVSIHGQDALICLNTPMHTYGDMTEQLASRQTIARNRGFFRIAAQLYLANGKLVRGASSKPKKPKDRMPGDRAGLGSVRRLAIALQRLDLTYDTEIMQAAQIRGVLPREFGRWSRATPAAESLQADVMS